jgi:putative FmdB family regulatory protein
MPIYDYDCSSCRHRVEVIHGIHDAGPRFCPSCGAEGTMRKALATPAIHFKGSGWAKKDRSSASGARAKSASSGPGDGASTDVKGATSPTAGGSAGSGGASAPGSGGASAAAAGSED